MKKLLFVILILMPFSIYADICLKNATPSLYIFASQGDKSPTLAPGESTTFNPKHKGGHINIWYSKSSDRGTAKYYTDVQALDNRTITITGNRKKPTGHPTTKGNECN